MNWTSKTKTNPASAGPVCILELNSVIIMPADGLAPNGARPLAGTMLTEKENMFSSKFLLWPMNLYPLCR